MKRKANKEVIKESMVRLFRDKEVVRSYIKGKISIEELKEKGITFGNPL